MDNTYSSIKFKIRNQERNNSFLKVFDLIKAKKEIYWENESLPDIKIKDWATLLDEKTYLYYLKIDKEKENDEQKVYMKLWELTKPEIRLNHTMFNRKNDWSFDSKISTIIEGEYELIEIKLNGNIDTLFFNPFSFPFGGTESLVSLIESFGNDVFYDSWHEGPHKRLKIGWDFELAKKLVSQNKGLTQ